MSITHKRVTDSISREAMAERFYNAALAAHTEARRQLVVCADRLAALAAEPWTKPADLARAAEAVAAAHDDVEDRNDLLAHAAHEEMAVKAAKIAEMANEVRSDEFGRAYTTIVSDMVEDAGMYLTKIRSLTRLFEICVAPRIRSLPERTPMTDMYLEEISNLRSDCVSLRRKAANLDKIASHAVSGYDGIYSRPKP